MKFWVSGCSFSCFESPFARWQVSLLVAHTRVQLCSVLYLYNGVSMDTVLLRLGDTVLMCLLIPSDSQCCGQQTEGPQHDHDQDHH